MASHIVRDPPTKTEWVDAVAALASFLVWAEETGDPIMFGGRTALEALTAASTITRLSMDTLVQIAHAGESP